MGQRADELAWTDRDTNVDATPTVMSTDVDTTTGEGQDPEEIRAQIEQTRAEMSETIDAIQEKLSPQRISEQVKEQVTESIEHAKESVREATIGRAEQMIQDVSDTVSETGSGLMDTIRRNPIPSALAGLSIGWLLMKSRESSGRQMRYGQRSWGYQGPYQGGYRGGYTGGYGPQYRGGYGPQTRGYQTGYESRPSQGGVGEAISTAQERVGEVAEQAREQVEHLGGQVQDAVMDAGERARDLGTTIVDTIRENPIPAAMIGIGLGWLLTSGRREGSPEQYRYGQYGTQYRGYQPSYGRYERGDIRSGGSIGQAVSGVQEKVGEAAGQARERVQEIGSQIGDQARTIGDQAASQVQQVGSQVQEQAYELGNEAQYQALRARYRLEEVMYESPLALGVAAFALGATLGMALPETPQEHRLMGEARDTLVERAQSVAQEAAEKVQRVAEEAGRAVQEQVQEQDLGQTVRKIADEVKNTAQQEAETQGLTKSQT